MNDRLGGWDGTLMRVKRVACKHLLKLIRGFRTAGVRDGGPTTKRLRRAGRRYGALRTSAASSA